MYHLHTLKVTLRLLKLLFYGEDVVEWSRELVVRLSDWCCIVSMVWVQIRRAKNTNLTARKSNYNTVWFNFQTYIYIYIYISSKYIRARVAQWVRSLDFLTTHTSLSPIRRGFAPGFVNYKKGALGSQSQVIKITSYLPMVGGSLRVLQLLPPLKLVAMI
jgi:hypothetical protein